MKSSTIGLDIAKNVFYVHVVDSFGTPIVSGQLRRGEVVKFFARISPALVGIEACATSHYWAREIIALGHEVRLMPPHHVRPYVKRQKSDAADAEAICEAVTRPSMRFLAVKSAEQQAALMLHRARKLLVRQKTCLPQLFALISRNSGSSHRREFTESPFDHTPGIGAGSTRAGVGTRGRRVPDRAVPESSQEAAGPGREIAQEAPQL